VHLVGAPVARSALGEDLLHRPIVISLVLGDDGVAGGFLGLDQEVVGAEVLPRQKPADAEHDQRHQHGEDGRDRLQRVPKHGWRRL
jgi:hypothetical protein